LSFLIGEIAARLTADDSGFQAKLSEAERRGKDTSQIIAREFDQVGQSLQKTGRQLSTRLTLPLVGFGALALRTAGDFESSMNRVSAISGATGQTLDAMTEQARELGATTQFSASQAADAMTFLAMAGFETNDIMSAMPSVLNLAAAAQLDMAQAADIASNIMAGFNMTADELQGAVDVLAKAFTSSNTDLLQLGDAMKFVGPVAKGFGVQFEETAAAVGFLSDAGLQASSAGTGLRRILTTLSREADKLGIEAYDSSGNMRSLADMIEQIETVGLSSARAMEIFGDRGGPAMQVLLSRGSESLREMTDELNNAGGTAQEIAEKQMEGLNGALLELKSAFEELQLAIADSGLIDFATDAVRAITSITQRLGDLHPVAMQTGLVLGGIGAAAGPAIWMMGSMTRNAIALTGALGGATTATNLLSIALRTIPLVAVGTAVVALSRHLADGARKTKEFREEIKKLQEAEATADDLQALNDAVAEQTRRVEQAERNFNRMGASSKAAIDGQRAAIQAMKDELDVLIQKRNEASVAQIKERIETERQTDATIDAVEATADATESVEEHTSAVRTSLQVLRERQRVTEQLLEMQQALAAMDAEQVWDWPDIDDVQLLGEKISDVGDDLNNASVQGKEFGDIMGNALSQAALHGRDLGEVLTNLAKQFASRAIVQGLGALVTGGASLGGGSFLGAVFGGLFHGGGVVPGSGERTIKAMGGEMVLTRSQQKALGSMQQPTASVSPAAMEKAFSKALSQHTRSLGPDEFFVLSEKGRRAYA